MNIPVLDRLEAIQPFTEAEAWTLFRIAALSEAVGWTLLIAAILIDRYKLPLHSYVIPIAGQIHGTIFLIYFGVLIATYTSLRWSRGKFIVSVLAGIPPYGTLAFELWASHSRRTKFSRIHFRSIALVTLIAT